MNHVLSGLAANVSLPPELLDRLIAVADAEVAWKLARRADLSHAHVLVLASRAEEIAVSLAYAHMLTAADVDPATQPEAALALLSERAGPPEWAHSLVNDPNVEHRMKLAACPDLPPDVVQKLAADPDVQVVAELALWTTSTTADRLATHAHAEVRRAVAANEATPPAVLSALLTGDGLPPAQRCLVCEREETPFVHDPECSRRDCNLPPGAACDGSHESASYVTRLMAVQNPATPDEAIVAYASDPSLYLRCAIAARPNLPPAVYSRLAADPHPGVRADLAENPSIGEALIRVLARDRHHEVRRRLARNPLVPLDVLTDLASTMKGAALLPRIASASPAEVQMLAESSAPGVRMFLAQRRDLPPAIRDALAVDPDAKVVKSVAPHLGLSERQLRAMVQRHGVQVVAKVASSPEASAALLEDLARHDPQVQKAFREIARHRNASAPALIACLADAQARSIAASHSALPPPVIEELLNDAHWQVVEAAASNPSLPLSVMSNLIPPAVSMRSNEMFEG